MPRISRVKAKHHASAVQVQPSKRGFAADGNVEHVLPGSSLDATITDVVQPVEPVASSSKKRSSAADLFPAPLVDHPYSKSHRKRLNKKIRQDLSGGQLHPLAAALAESLGQKAPEDKKARVRSREEKEKERMEEERKKAEEGKIGQGRGRTLGEKKRRDLISNEAKRREAIMNHNQFKSDPWATIRLHAGNSLATKEATIGNGRKQPKKQGATKAPAVGGMELDE